MYIIYIPYNLSLQHSFFFVLFLSRQHHPTSLFWNYCSTVNLFLTHSHPHSIPRLTHSRVLRLSFRWLFKVSVLVRTVPHHWCFPVTPKSSHPLPLLLLTPGMDGRTSGNILETDSNTYLPSGWPSTSRPIATHWTQCKDFSIESTIKLLFDIVLFPYSPSGQSLTKSVNSKLVDTWT